MNTPGHSDTTPRYFSDPGSCKQKIFGLAAGRFGSPLHLHGLDTTQLRGPGSINSTTPTFADQFVRKLLGGILAVNLADWSGFHPCHNLQTAPTGSPRFVHVIRVRGAIRASVSPELVRQPSGVKESALVFPSGSHLEWQDILEQEVKDFAF